MQQLNVFADDDVDAAAEAVSEVRSSTFFCRYILFYIILPLLSLYQN